MRNDKARQAKILAQRACSVPSDRFEFLSWFLLTDSPLKKQSQKNQVGLKGSRISRKAKARDIIVSGCRLSARRFLAAFTSVSSHPRIVHSKITLPAAIFGIIGICESVFGQPRIALPRFCPEKLAVRSRNFCQS